MISFKERVDNLAELDIDFNNIKMTTIKDYFPAVMYPGFIITFGMSRDPFAKLVKHIIPVMMLDFLIMMTFQLRIDKLIDRLSVVAILVLTFSHVNSQLKHNFPCIRQQTLSDKFMTMQILMTLLPILSSFTLASLDNEDVAEIIDSVANYLVFVLIISSALFIIYGYRK